MSDYTALLKRLTKAPLLHPLSQEAVHAANDDRLEAAAAIRALERGRDFHANLHDRYNKANGKICAEKVRMKAERDEARAEAERLREALELVAAPDWRGDESVSDIRNIASEALAPQEAKCKACRDTGSVPDEIDNDGKPVGSMPCPYCDTTRAALKPAQEGEKSKCEACSGFGYWVEEGNEDDPIPCPKCNPLARTAYEQKDAQPAPQEPSTLDQKKARVAELDKKIVGYPHWGAMLTEWNEERKSLLHSIAAEEAQGLECPECGRAMQRTTRWEDYKSEPIVERRCPAGCPVPDSGEDG